MTSAGWSALRGLPAVAAAVLAWSTVAGVAHAQAIPVRVKLLTTPEEQRLATSQPGEFTTIGPTTYFVAEDRVNGRELWKTDGTAEGTVLVRDIWPGDSRLTGPRNLFNFNGVLLFAATDGVHGLELWRSDGTATGTYMLKDIEPGAIGSEPRDFVDGGDQAFFTAPTSMGEPGFWRTDGTSAGTYRVKASGACCMADGSCQVLLPAVCQLVGGWTQPSRTVCETTVCPRAAAFVCCLPDLSCRYLNAQLCGEQGGTLLPGGATCVPRSCPARPAAACCLADGQCVVSIADDCIAAGGRTYGVHAACDPSNMCTAEFTRCCYPDGTCTLALNSNACTAAGGSGGALNVTCEVSGFQCAQPTIGCCRNDGTCQRVRLADCLATGGIPSTYGPCSGSLCPDPSPAAGSVGVPVLTIGGRVFLYEANEDNPRHGLWVWDGTPDGFEFLKALPTFNSDYSQIPRYFTELNGKLLFAMNDGISGFEWWTSDGTIEGTHLVTDINPGPAHAVQTSYATAAPVKGDGVIYFFAEDGVHGRQLWRTDGSSEGTTRLTNLPGLSNSTGPIMRIGEGAVFFALLGSAQNHLYRLEPTSPTGCEVLSDQEFPTEISTTASSGEQAFFSSNTSDGLWVTDGTTEGTRGLITRDELGGWSASSLYWDPGLGRLFFSAGELWASDGTAAGTAQFKDIASGVSSRVLEPVGGDRLIFPAPETGLGLEPFISDGTPEGTRLLKDINPGTASSNPQNFTALGRENGQSVVYFTADSPGFAQTLWVTDGTPQGTRSVGDAAESGGELLDSSKSSELNGVVYFRAGTSATGRELYRTDGTPEGTRPVYELPGSEGVFWLTAEFDRVVTGDLLYFIGRDTLYRTDGTTAGTFPLKTGSMRLCTESGGIVYFLFNGLFWKSNGTAAGTVPVETADAPPYFEDAVSVVQGRLYCSGRDSGPGAHGTELWTTDLLTGVSTRLTDINPGSADSFPSMVVAFDGTAVFAATSGSERRLYQTNGTPEGTVLAFGATGFSQYVERIYAWNGKLFLSTRNGLWAASSLAAQPTLLSDRASLNTQLPAADRVYIVGSRPIWVTDGTPTGTREAVATVEGAGDWYQQGPIVVGSRLYFISNGTHGLEWYRTEDDSSGTAHRVTEFLPGVSGVGGDARPMAVIGSRILFTSSSPLSGLGVFALDTSAPEPSVPTRVGPGSSVKPLGGTSFIAADPELYFTNRYPDGSAGGQLYRTDGTGAGTSFVADFSPVPGDRGHSGLTPLVAADGALYFRGDRPDTGSELFRIGPSAEIELLPELRPGIESSYPRNAAAVADKVFYSAMPPEAIYDYDCELAVTDGTSEGTRFLGDLWPGIRGSVPQLITDLNGLAVFTAEDGVRGRELWSSDGTVAGTRLVKDIMAGPESPGIAAMYVVGGFVYFTADDGVHGRELWRSDGTEAGTTLVRDIWIGPGSAHPTWLTPTGDRLHFVAYTPETGPELWITDGTPNGTFMLFQFQDGPGGANINQLTVSGNRLYFLATTLPDGTGLWTYEWPGALLAFCPADYDRTGGVSVGDIFAFLYDWFGGASRADFSGNGVISVQDIFEFLAAYFSGCG